ncbi:ribosome biogenesis factor YjgA [Desulfogranum mediterraneum]|uniref:ribosome biogenesis factor YjgA n=1 Tax=Desulfogranum mediterraneum TaxID=160661 RepID=UPI0004031498|nr:ribosome biogenesis factor YjgA [Desulfogranum mediterraneum]
MQLSRTEQKRRIKEVEKLVVELAALPSQIIGQCPCSREVRAYLQEIADLKGGARKRQVKYVTKLMKGMDLEEVYAFIGQRRGRELIKTKQFHEVEYWRDSLVNEALAQRKLCKEEELEWSERWNSETVATICAELPGAEEYTLLRLAYLFVQTRNPKHSREIFRYLMALKEQQRFAG